MTKAEKIKNFDPSGVGINNGNFIGLPFNEEESEIVLLPVTWDVTVSFAEGTASGPENILASSYQLDLGHLTEPELWKRGIFFKPIDKKQQKRSLQLRELASSYIDFLEEGGNISENKKMQNVRDTINEGCLELKNEVYLNTKKLLQEGKKVGLIGGDHSTPLGYLEALAEIHSDFGVLQIDAHQDLRNAYEGFTYSHASIFHNALKIKQISKLTQVGIRDFCEEETQCVHSEKGRVTTYYDQNIREQIYAGIPFAEVCLPIVESLPPKVYISFDIDGLRPEFCPNTGTPVPGGLDFNEALFLLRQIKLSGREIIGFDLSETAGLGHDWDGNVGARVVYNLCALL